MDSFIHILLCDFWEIVYVYLIRYDSKSSDFFSSSLLFRCFFLFYRNTNVWRIVFRHAAHSTTNMQILFFVGREFLPYHQLQIAKSKRTHTHTVSDTRNSHGHTCTHAHKDFSRFTRPNHLYLFSKITSWTNFFSHTLSFLFFSLLLVCCCCYCWWCEWVCVSVFSLIHLFFFDGWLTLYIQKRREKNFCYTTLQCINPDWNDSTKFDHVFSPFRRAEREQKRNCASVLVFEHEMCCGNIVFYSSSSQRPSMCGAI